MCFSIDNEAHYKPALFWNPLDFLFFFFPTYDHICCHYGTTLGFIPDTFDNKDDAVWRFVSFIFHVHAFDVQQTYCQQMQYTKTAMPSQIQSVRL